MISTARGDDARKARALVHSAFEARYHDLTRLLSLASAAVAFVEEKTGVLPAEVVASAWMQYGNALRILGKHRAAEQALEWAGALPVADLQTRVELLEVRAALHRTAGRLDEAVRCLTAALELQRFLSNCPLQSRTYNLLGLVWLEAEERPRALSCFRTALERVVPSTPYDLAASAGHNLIETLLAEGRLAAASAALVSLGPLYERVRSSRLSGKAEWMRAHLCYALRQIPAARLAYERAYELLRRDPRVPELPVLTAEMAEIFPLATTAAQG